MAQPQKISTCLWFDHEAEEAAKFYTSLFDNSRIRDVVYYGDNGHMPEGTVLTISFELAGTEFTALNGGPHFTFSEACSLVVRCDNQAEIDRLWQALLQDGGREQQCGWLKDKYGLPWQIIPASLQSMLVEGDREKSGRVMAALMKMVKLDMAALEAAYHGN
jgi:predicted 3-demethylubiquinone-9 3-methyltransferase (glyoxalase superfamily)